MILLPWSFTNLGNALHIGCSSKVTWAVIFFIIEVNYELDILVEIIIFNCDVSGRGGSHRAKTQLSNTEDCLEFLFLPEI